MPHTKSAVKRLRQSESRRIRNRRVRSRARTTVKKAFRLIEAGQLEEAREAIEDAYSALDKAATKGVMHKNKAARHKAQLMRRFNKTQQTQ
ncbi:MAG: 30S ribosomal protein S20 [Anaerolineae bacterium]